MTREECIQQLDSLIEHFHNGGSDFNATDVLAIKKILEQNQKYKEVINKIKEWEQNHTILVYTKNAPRKLVGTHELLHILYDKEVE